MPVEVFQAFGGCVQPDTIHLPGLGDMHKVVDNNMCYRITFTPARKDGNTANMAVSMKTAGSWRRASCLKQDGYYWLVERQEPEVRAPDNF